MPNSDYDHDHDHDYGSSHETQAESPPDPEASGEYAAVVSSRAPRDATSAAVAATHHRSRDLCETATHRAVNKATAMHRSGIPSCPYADRLAKGTATMGTAAATAAAFPVQMLLGRHQGEGMALPGRLDGLLHSV